MSLRDIKTPNSICIVRLSALGDVTLLIPTVRRLQGCFPNAKITWITSKVIYDFLKGLSGVEFIVIDKPKSIKDYLKFRRLMQSYQFDVLLAMQASLRANFLYPFIKAKVKVGFDKKRARDLHALFVGHQVEFGEDHLLRSFLRFADFLSCKDNTIRWDLDFAAKDITWGEKNLPVEDFVVINPAASKQERTWMADRYVEVIDYIYKNWRLKIVLTGGPSSYEIDLAEQIIAKVNAPIINLVAKTSMKQLAVVLKRSRLLISPDTGPVHIATALTTPVIGLYAVAPAELSGPYFSKKLTINKFPQAVKEILNKNPDSVPWGTRVHSSEAMSLISVDEVVEKLKLVLGESL